MTQPSVWRRICCCASRTASRPPRNVAERGDGEWGAKAKSPGILLGWPLRVMYSVETAEMSKKWTYFFLRTFLWEIYSEHNSRSEIQPQRISFAELATEAYNRHIFIRVCEIIFPMPSFTKTIILLNNPQFLSSKTTLPWLPLFQRSHTAYTCTLLHNTSMFVPRTVWHCFKHDLFVSMFCISQKNYHIGFTVIVRNLGHFNIVPIT